MYRSISISVIAGVLVICFPHVCRADCPPVNSQIYFLNGINSTPEGGAAALQATLNNDLPAAGAAACDVRVDPLTNRSFGVLADLCESALQLQLVNSTSDCLDAINGLLPNSPRNAAIVQYAIQYTAGSPDITQILSQYQNDLTLQVQTIRQALDSDPSRQIVIVSHSQGNLFANDALLKLLQLRGPSVLGSVAIVSAATPAGDVIGGGIPQPYVTLEEDFIHDVPGALPANATDISSTPCDESLNPFRCHDFVATYLVTPLTKPRIVRRVRNALALGPAVITHILPDKGTDRVHW